MLAIAAGTLQAIDLGMLLAGAAAGVGFVVWLAASGSWRDPLADVRATGDGPTLVHVGVAVVLLFATMALGTELFLRGPTAPGARVPGSAAWHRVLGVEMAAKLPVTAVMAAMLLRWRSFAPQRPDGRRVALLLVAAVLAVLVITPVCVVQLRAASLAWEWLSVRLGWPTGMPTHPVLSAIAKGELGTWETVQLLGSALVVAPLAEELFFRGLVLEAFWRHTGLAWVAVTGSAAVFGAVHYGVPQSIVPLVTLGIALGYVRLRTKSLGACVLVHALFNARTMIPALLAPELIESI